MTSTVHERPGVYSSYDLSAVISGDTGGKTVGLVGICTEQQAGELYKISRYEDAVAAFGVGTPLARLTRILLLNGAAQVYVCTVTKAEEYERGFAYVGGLDGVGVMVCDSEVLAVQQKLRQSVIDASAARRERICVVGGTAGETVEELVERAAGLNCERVVLVSPDGQSEGTELAAAVAGAIAGERDPAVPLGGALLKGVRWVGERYKDSDVDLLVRGGVTPLEEVDGETYVIRGVTTRTKTGAAPDRTWRELAIVRVADDVIPAVRNSLRAKFQRAKNTPQSRGAIRAQVVLELEGKLAKEIIGGYDAVEVRADAENPTVCLVDFAFTVTYGLNQIWLSAHIMV